MTDFLDCPHRPLRCKKHHLTEKSNVFNCRGWWTVGVWYVYGLWRRHRATILRQRVTSSVSVGGMEYALHRTEQLQWLWQYEVNSSWSIEFVLQNSPSQQPNQKIRLRRRERKCCPHATAKPEFYVGNNTTEIIATRRPHLQWMIWAKLALRRCTEGEASDVVRLKRRLFLREKNRPRGTKNTTVAIVL